MRYLPPNPVSILSEDEFNRLASATSSEHGLRALARLAGGSPERAAYSVAIIYCREKNYPMEEDMELENILKKLQSYYRH